MRRVVIALAGVAMVAVVACGGSGGAPPEGSPEPTAAVISVTAPPGAVAPQMKACADELEVDCAVEAIIEAELEDCVGSAPMRCMVVNGGLFYSEIEGFEHEAGYRYRIRMERYDPWGGEPPPADASSRGYRLIEVVEKTRVR